MIATNLTRSLQTTAKQPQVARESEYYLAKISKIKNIEDFIADRRVFSYAMKAYNLDDMIDAKAYMRKVLKEGVDESDSFANSLTDPRFKEFATAFNFARYGEATTVFERTRQGTVDRFVRNTLELQVSGSNEGAGMALYFQRKAPEITSPYKILADRTLLKVVQTALGLDSSTSYMSVDRQAQLIESKLKIADLSDPAKLEKFIIRFSSMWDLQNGIGMTQVPNITGNRQSTISTSLLQSLQRLKLGG